MTPARRVQLYFFAQFLSVGMINAYAGIWFASIGLSAFQIGLIGAVPVAALLALTLLIGRVADRAQDWRQVIILGAFLSAIFPVGLFYADSFLLVLLCWTLLATAQRLIVPVADAAGLRMARREGMAFGKLRGLSTIGYLMVVLIAGYLLRDLGVALFLPIFVALGFVRAIAAFGLPRLRAPGDVVRTGHPRLWSSVSRAFVFTVFGWALIDSNHIILNSFQGLLWARQGISTEIIGLLIALGAAAETVMFFAFAPVIRRFSPRTLMIAAAGFSVIRWIGLSMAPGVAVLIPLQMMHALTYAMGFLACTNYIADNTSEDNAAEAQGFFVMLELGVSAIALMTFGWLAGLWGAGAYLFSAVLALTGAGLIIAAHQPHPAPDKSG